MREGLADVISIHSYTTSSEREKWVYLDRLVQYLYPSVDNVPTIPNVYKFTVRYAFLSL